MPPSLKLHTAADILRQAATIVSGDRNTTHGSKERSFDTIACFWNLYLRRRKDRDLGPITPTDVAQMMVLLKIARAIEGTATLDHFMDEAGYAAIAGELGTADAPDAAPAAVKPAVVSNWLGPVPQPMRP